MGKYTISTVYSLCPVPVICYRRFRKASIFRIVEIFNFPTNNPVIKPIGGVLDLCHLDIWVGGGNSSININLSSKCV